MFSPRRIAELNTGSNGDGGHQHDDASFSVAQFADALQKGPASVSAPDVAHIHVTMINTTVIILPAVPEISFLPRQFLAGNGNAGFSPNAVGGLG